MSKFTGILKMAGLTFLLCCGTIFEGIGLPLLFVGQSKADKAMDTFLNSEEYKEIRGFEDQRLEGVKENIEQLEIRYENGEIPFVEYQFVKKGYEDDIANSEENFVSEAFDKLADDNLKGMLKSGNLMNNIGWSFAIGGGCFYSMKLIGFVVDSIIEGSVSDPVGEFCIDLMKEVVEDEFTLGYYEEQLKKEKKQIKLDKKRKAKEAKQDEGFIDDDEEVLGNIDDTYYCEET